MAAEHRRTASVDGLAVIVARAFVWDVPIGEQSLRSDRSGDLGLRELDWAVGCSDRDAIRSTCQRSVPPAGRLLNESTPRKFGSDCQVPPMLISGLNPKLGAWSPRNRDCSCFPPFSEERLIGQVCEKQHAISRALLPSGVGEDC